LPIQSTQIKLSIALNDDFTLKGHKSFSLVRDLTGQNVQISKRESVPVFRRANTLMRDELPNWLLFLALGGEEISFRTLDHISL
jgi:hypothetical protein